MTSEVYTPQPLGADATTFHPVVFGEVVAPKASTKEKVRFKNIPSEEVLLWSSRAEEDKEPVTLATLEYARRLLGIHVEELRDSELSDKLADLIVDEALPIANLEDVKDYEIRHRADMKKALLLSEKKFDRFAKQHKVTYARLQNLEIVRTEAATEDEEQKEKTPISSRIKSALGAVATKSAGVIDKAKARWEKRKNTQSNDETAQDDGLFDEEPYRASQPRKSQKVREAAWTGATAVVSKGSKIVGDYTDRRKERHEALTPEQREKKKTRNKNLVAVVGGVAVLAATAWIMRHGIDNPFNTGGAKNTDPATSSSGLADLLNLPFGDNHQDIVSGDHLNLDHGLGEHGHSGGGMSRPELFDGQYGTRHLTPTGSKEMLHGLNDYKVKSGDSVWNLSERLLKQHGISNPTVFEIDATKDTLLRELRSTGQVDSRGWLSVGDTLHIK